MQGNCIACNKNLLLRQKMVVYDKAVAFVKRTIVMFFVIFFLIIFCYWQNNAIVVTNYVYASSKINESLNGYRIVQISNLHNKRFGKNQEKLIEKLKECEPNLIVITGDLVDSNRLDMEPAIEFVRGAVQLALTYFITGNHEIWLSENDLDCLLNMLVLRLQINQTLYLFKFPSATLSSVDVATATPPSSALQNENLYCAYSLVHRIINN